MENQSLNISDFIDLDFTTLLLKGVFRTVKGGCISTWRNVTLSFDMVASPLEVALSIKKLDVSGHGVDVTESAERAFILSGVFYPDGNAGYFRLFPSTTTITATGSIETPEECREAAKHKGMDSQNTYHFNFQQTRTSQTLKLCVFSEHHLGTLRIISATCPKYQQRIQTSNSPLKGSLPCPPTQNLRHFPTPSTPVDARSKPAFSPIKPLRLNDLFAYGEGSDTDLHSISPDLKPIEHRPVKTMNAKKSPGLFSIFRSKASKSREEAQTPLLSSALPSRDGGAQDVSDMEDTLTLPGTTSRADAPAFAQYHVSISNVSSRDDQHSAEQVTVTALTGITVSGPGIGKYAEVFPVESTLTVPSVNSCTTTPVFAASSVTPGMQSRGHPSPLTPLRDTTTATRTPLLTMPNAAPASHSPSLLPTPRDGAEGGAQCGGGEVSPLRLGAERDIAKLLRRALELQVDIAADGEEDNDSINRNDDINCGTTAHDLPVEQKTAVPSPSASGAYVPPVIHSPRFHRIAAAQEHLNLPKSVVDLKCEDTYPQQAFETPSPEPKGKIEVPPPDEAAKAHQSSFMGALRSAAMPSEPLLPSKGETSAADVRGEATSAGQAGQGEEREGHVDKAGQVPVRRIPGLEDQENTPCLGPSVKLSLGVKNGKLHLSNSSNIGSVSIQSQGLKTQSASSLVNPLQNTLLLPPPNNLVPTAPSAHPVTPDRRKSPQLHPISPGNFFLRVGFHVYVPVLGPLPTGLARYLAAAYAPVDGDKLLRDYTTTKVRVEGQNGGIAQGSGVALTTSQQRTGNGSICSDRSTLAANSHAKTSIDAGKMLGASNPTPLHSTVVSGDRDRAATPRKHEFTTQTRAVLLPAPLPDLSPDVAVDLNHILRATQDCKPLGIATDARGNIKATSGTGTGTGIQEKHMKVSDSDRVGGRDAANHEDGEVAMSNITKPAKKRGFFSWLTQKKK